MDDQRFISPTNLVDLNKFIEVIPPGITIENACNRLFINRDHVLAIEKIGNQQEVYKVTTTVEYKGETEFTIDPKWRKRMFPCFRFC